MSDDDAPGPERQRSGIPRDLPDQEAGVETDGRDAEPAGPAEKLPDTDEAGSGPRSAPPRTADDPGQGLEPDEPTD